jgi:hypothetical protein
VLDYVIIDSINFYINRNLKLEDSIMTMNKLFSHLIGNEVGIIYTNTISSKQEKVYNVGTDSINYNFLLNLTGKKYVLQFKPKGVNYNYKQLKQRSINLIVHKTFGRQDKLKITFDIINLLK